MKARIALVVVLMAVGPFAFAAGPDACTLVKQSFDAWNVHDADKVVAFYTDDVMYEDVTFDVVSHGSGEMRKMASAFFNSVPELKLEVVSCSAGANGGSVEWIFSGTDAGLYKTGKKFSVRGASRFELRGGKFSSNKDFYDAASIMRQVGVLPSTPDVHAADEQAVRDADAAFSKAAAAHDLEATVAFYADDASVLAANTPLLTGKDAIRKLWSEMVATKAITVSWQASKVEASRGGDLVYMVGSYEEKSSDPNAKPDHGKYTEVWKKQADGNWKVVVDAFNTDLPAPTE